VQENAKRALCKLALRRTFPMGVAKILNNCVCVCVCDVQLHLSGLLIGWRDRVVGKVRVWLDIVTPPIRPKLHSLLLTGRLAKGKLDVGSTHLLCSLSLFLKFCKMLV